MNSRPLRAITDDEFRTFEADGFVRLCGMFDDDWIERLRRATEVMLDRPGPAGADFNEGGQSGRMAFDKDMWLYNDDFRAFIFESPAAELAATILNSPFVNLVMQRAAVQGAAYADRHQLPSGRYRQRGRGASARHARVARYGDPGERGDAVGARLAQMGALVHPLRGRCRRRDRGKKRRGLSTPTTPSASWSRCPTSTTTRRVTISSPHRPNRAMCLSRAC